MPPEPSRASAFPTHGIDLAHACALAERAARAGAAVALRHFRDPRLRVETKGDGSPVSVADREAELAVRAVLASDALLGACDVLGEEHGASGAGSALRWVIDPIDGTQQFVRGIPLFGTLVALEDAATSTALVGVLLLPAIGACYAAARGLGATRDGAPIRVDDAQPPAEALLHVPSAHAFRSRGFGAQHAALLDRHHRVRGYFDCFGHAMVAEGAFGLAVELGVARWDVAASSVLVEEAGGVVLLRPADRPGRVDALFGTAALVERYRGLLGF